MDDHADPRTPNIWEALVAIRNTQGNGIALISEAGNTSTFAELEGYVNHSAQLLRDWGIDIKDRVALVTDNGPHAVAAFLALFGVCACFPQNPATSYEECLKYLEDGRVSAVLHKEGLDSDFISAARTLKVPVIFFSADESLPGFISIASPEIASSDMKSIPSGSDTALILQTSGTTSRPKVVPFSHERLIGTALSFAASLELSVNDRTVNVTPLFHGYGLNTVVLATLFSGGAVVCCKGFATEKFLEILETMEVTWFSAVPTILQAIAQDLPQGGINHRLRFIRSGSASLPFTVAEDLERVLAVPVIEAYATTETVLISSNPVSMNRRKRGSAGIPRECEVEIRNSEGSPPVSPQRGEIWVRGPLVMKGYENDEEENARVLVDGWYRTGDEGYFDEEGYLYITGRIKETINRGGEKISPGEIDEILLSHPEVLEAAAFPVDHSTLGEDIAAAVVLSEGSSLTEEHLKSYTATRLSPFKIPSRIVAVQEIPKGPTGKFVRHSLSEMIIFPEQENRPAETDHEKLVASLWKDLLGSSPRGTEDDFFASGGNSILAARLVSAIENITGVKIPIGQIFMARTLALIARELEHPAFHEMPDDMVLIKSGTLSRTLYCFPFNRNGVSLNYGKFSSTLPGDVRVVGMEKPSSGEFSTLEENASDACDRILQTQPEGPFRLLGFCYGGPLALKTSMILEERGHEVFCCLIDFPFFKKNFRHYLEYGIYYLISRNKWLMGHFHPTVRYKINLNSKKFQVKTFWSDRVYFRSPCLLVTGKFIHSRGISKAHMKASMKHFEKIEHIATDLDHLHMLDGPASIEVGRIIGTWFQRARMGECRMEHAEELS